ncbi:MAG: succinate dehydrogenase, cytochrome b556 subunit [Alphaproteobacteria bacterium]
MSNRERPLSPHLQIYKPQITSMTSIAHRITGVGLILGLVMITFWLAAAAAGPDAYEAYLGFATSWFGKLLLLGFVWAFFYHLCNGIRHLAWDLGFGFEIDDAEASGKLVIIGSVALTGLALFIANFS